MVFPTTINPNYPQRPLQENIHYGLGSIYLGINVIWAQKCATYIPKGSEQKFQRIFG
jgi:hypothetical protein